MQHRGGHTPVWPAAPPAPAAATTRGGPPAAARRCGTGVWLAGRSWAGVAHLLAGITGAGQVQHRGGHTPVWPAAPPAPAAATTRGGPPAAVRHGCVAGRAQLGRCRTLACWHQWGWASAAQGWAHPRLACCTTGTGGGDDPRRPAGGGEAVRHGCVAGRAQLGRCRTLACWHQWGWASAAQGWAHPRLACCTTGTGGGDDPRRPAGGGEAVRHGCVAGRAQLGRCRALACWRQWGWASAAQGWAQPGLACCTTGTGGGDDPRRPAGGGEAVRHECVAGRAQLGRCRTLACWHHWGWASAAQGWAHPRLACCTTGTGGGDDPRRPAGGGEAVRHGCVAGRAQLGRCRTLACWHQWGWASAAQGWAHPRLACCTTGTGGGDDPRRPAGGGAGGAARVCGWQGAAGQVSHTCLLASVGLGKCSTGVGTPPSGLLHHRHRRRRRPAAARRRRVEHPKAPARRLITRMHFPGLMMGCWVHSNTPPRTTFHRCWRKPESHLGLMKQRTAYSRGGIIDSPGQESNQGPTGPLSRLSA